MPEFAIGESDFLLAGEPHRILSGALHYFRVHPDQWADRIDAARRMGLNTIETYVAWNAHSPAPGVFDTDGGCDLDRFLRLVAEAGMHAIVRPGPYICAEWANGGLPTWLLRRGVRLRSSDPGFLDPVREYLRTVLAIVAPHQVDRSGPVLLVQVENEYGAYGDDAAYLRALVETTRAAGITVPLITVDQPQDAMLAAGRVDGALMTASFGSRASERLATLRRHQPRGPLMCGEFWIGWFDSWGTHHHTTPAVDAAAELDAMLAAGASVNVYMVHGGTNPGLTSGANDKGTYQPIVTSYDYDAPLDEAGRPTAKYHALRAVLARYTDVPPAPPDPPPAPALSVALGDPVGLLGAVDRLGAGKHHAELPLLDDLDPVPHLLVATTALGGPDRPAVLTVAEVRDRIAVFLDGAPVGVLDRDRHDRALTVPSGRGELTLLVEDQGRVNYGPRLGEPKGVLGPVEVDGDVVGERGWEVVGVDPAAVPRLWEPGTAIDPARGPVPGPVAVRGRFDLDAPADLFLDTSGWGKGLAWCNGVLLGRYWSRGPQRTLYVPAPLTRAGTNELVVLELVALPDPVARFVPDLLLGHTEV